MSDNHARGNTARVYVSEGTMRMLTEKLRHFDGVADEIEHRQGTSGALARVLGNRCAPCLLSTAVSNANGY